MRIFAAFATCSINCPESLPLLPRTIGVFLKRTIFGGANDGRYGWYHVSAPALHVVSMGGGAILAVTASATATRAASFGVTLVIATARTADLRHPITLNPKPLNPNILNPQP